MKEMNRVVTPEKASEIFSLNVGSLANLRAAKKGCPYFKRGRRVYYKISDLEEWLFENPIKTKDSVGI